MTPQLLLTAGGTIEITEYQSQRLVSLAMIDKLHGRIKDTAKRNFKHNIKQFVEGQDFFRLKGDEIRPPSANFDPEGLTLYFTENGYLMLIKSFKDDLAWKVQRDLVTMYFRARQVQAAAQNVTEATIELFLADPTALRSALARYNDRVIELEGKIAEMKPKEDFYDDVVNTKDLHSVGSVAKLLGLSRNKFFHQLRVDHILCFDNLPREQYKKQGLFEVKLSTWYEGDVEHACSTTKVTSKGLAYLYRKYSPIPEAELLALLPKSKGGHLPATNTAAFSFEGHLENAIQ